MLQCIINQKVSKLPGFRWAQILKLQNSKTLRFWNQNSGTPKLSNSEILKLNRNSETLKMSETENSETKLWNSETKLWIWIVSKDLWSTFESSKLSIFCSPVQLQNFKISKLQSFEFKVLKFDIKRSRGKSESQIKSEPVKTYFLGDVKVWPVLILFGILIFLCSVLYGT
jgi:hypothetical protein